MSTDTEVETIPLTGWGTFEDLEGNIRALLFDQLLERALPVVKEYRSDLFHDAMWLREHLTSERLEFDFMVRHSGTNIGTSASIQAEIGPGAGAILYRVRLLEERGAWSATFTVIERF